MCIFSNVYLDDHDRTFIRGMIMVMQVKYFLGMENRKTKELDHLKCRLDLGRPKVFWQCSYNSLVVVTDVYTIEFTTHKFTQHSH